MGTHSGRVFLASCLKTPIDPCNNCPAPIYNRPKMYLGRLSTVTPSSTITKQTTTSMKTPENTANTTGTLWTNTGIRTLAEFYDSIPDYCDINHLTGDEFYSTLDSLRSTCRELKTKPPNVSLLEDSNTSTLSSNTVTKSKKSCKKKNSTLKKGCSKKKTKESKKAADPKVELSCIPSITPCSEVLETTRYRSCKEDFQQEVAAFKKTLKDFEDELRCRSTSISFSRSKSSNLIPKIETPKSKIDENTQTDLEDTPIPNKTYSVNVLQKSLRKAFSFNDIDSISDSPVDSVGEKQHLPKPKPLDKLTKAESLAFKDNTRLSNYFAEPVLKQNMTTTNELPKIKVQSPTSEFTSSTTTTGRSTEKQQQKDSKAKKQYSEQLRVPFTIFALGNSSTKKENMETPSPVHPVARPNLAATLRAEVSKKKLKELQNNCTYYDRTPQFDWEVRKTPAWRTLTLNESHKEILALRLATRKAEQALQQREYELNMELMRQRVKSAPLLLEGNTFWGPNVGKLTHNCQNEGMRHTCESLQRKQRKKCLRDTNSDIDRSHLGLPCKMYDFRKIYTNSAKSPAQSRNSQHSRRRKDKKRHLPQVTSRPSTLIESTARGINDSGDDLSSGDRAFL